MSKIGEMRKLLLAGKYTKEELAAKTGVALSTVSVQLGYHLKNQGFVIHNEIVDGKKLYWMTEKTDAEYDKEAEAEGNEITPEDRADEGDDDVEPTDTDLEKVKEEGLDKIPADAELEALLDE
jgi:hypothetical protein